MNIKVLLTRNKFIVIGAALLIGIAVYTGNKQPGAGKKQGRQPIPVEVTRAARADIPVLLKGLGTVQALNTVTVHARIDGELTRVAFTEGQAVHRGDLLAQIDPRPNQAAADQAAATLDKDTSLLANARLDLERYRLLEPQNLASHQQIDTQRALVDQLAAQVKLDQAALFNARTQLEYTRIMAPIDGLAGIRLIDQGNIIHAADPGGLVVLTQVQPIAVVFTLPEEQLGAITAAFGAGPLEVAAEIRGAEGNPEKGTLTLIDNQVDPATGTIKFKALFPNKDQRLWPGQYVTATLKLRVDKGVTVIPTTAVVTGPQGPFTYLVNADRSVEPRNLSTAQEYDGQTVVTAGIAPGDTVVVSNQYRLQPGVKIAADISKDVKAHGGQDSKP